MTIALTNFVRDHEKARDHSADVPLTRTEFFSGEY